MDALDAAFGATEGAVGDAHALSFRKLAVFIAKVFQPGLSRRGNKHKHVHLPVGDGIRLASAVIAMAGVEDGAVGELTLRRAPRQRGKTSANLSRDGAPCGAARLAPPRFLPLARSTLCRRPSAPPPQQKLCCRTPSRHTNAIRDFPLQPFA